jgi:hypothetical protein
MPALVPHLPDAPAVREGQGDHELASRNNWPAVLGLVAGLLSVTPGVGLLLGPFAIGLSRLGLHLAPHRGGRRLAVASLTAAVTLFSLHAMVAMLLLWLLKT